MSINKKYSIRFGVKNAEGLHSRTWKLVADNDEVYILNRKLGHYLKASLHASGIWQVSFSSEVAAKKKIKNQDRHIIRWKRPDSNIANGVTLAFRLLIPTSELRNYQESLNNSKNIFWLNAPDSEYAVEVAVIYTHPTVKVTGWVGKNHKCKLLGETILLNGERLWIVYRDIQLTKNDIKLLQTYKDGCLKASNIEFGGGILIGHENDSSRKFMEVALH